MADIKEKLKTLSLPELREIAKANHIKNCSTLRKGELIEKIASFFEEQKTDSVPKPLKEEPAAPKTEEVSVPEEPKPIVTVGDVSSIRREGDSPKPREYRPRNNDGTPRNYNSTTGSFYRNQNGGGTYQNRGNRNETRGGYQNRGENRYDNRSDSRGEYRGENRYENRNENRYENRGDNRGTYRKNYRRPAGEEEANTRYPSRSERAERYETAESRGRQEDAIDYETAMNAPREEYESRSEATSDEANFARLEQAMHEDEDQGALTLSKLDSGNVARGILEVCDSGYGFLRTSNYLGGTADVYVAPSQIRRFRMKTGDVVGGSLRIKTGNEKYAALLFVTDINGYEPDAIYGRPSFEDLTPVFPSERLHLEYRGCSRAMRIVDLLSPIGKGQRGMIVSPPKAGKTTLLKEVAKAMTENHPDVHLIILLIDERPEEVTDIRESIVGEKVEVIYSTFDETPDHHKRVSEMVLERAKRLVEHGKDVMILLDSITRLARAYNLVVQPSGRTLSGGLDPAALYMPKRFFGSARNTREGGSLTILATALVDTGSRMDDVVFEEFKGTGNMELVLDRKLSEKRIFPAVDILRSGTRRDDLLLSPEERSAADLVHKVTADTRQEDAVERVLNLFAQTRNNNEFIQISGKLKFMNDAPRNPRKKEEG